MSRKREFRGRRIDNGEWVYGYLAAEDEIMVWDEDKGTGQMISVDADTVGQWTGETDDGGTKVYEGSGGSSRDLGRYWVDFGPYGLGHIGYRLRFTTPFFDRTCRKDLEFWIKDGLIFSTDIYTNPELLEVQ